MVRLQDTKTHMATLAQIVEKLETRFSDALEDVCEFRGEFTVRVKPDALVEMCTFLRDDPDCAFDFLSDISGVDYYPEEPRFGVNYHLTSTKFRRQLRLKVRVSGPDPRAPTVTCVWPAANWFERETYDLFGVTFVGHPDLRRILLPQDFQGHPLRRDQPLVQEEVQFTHNFDEIDRTKPYAES
jgi:NADH-quinone oxidoreductase subunit C